MPTADLTPPEFVTLEIRNPRSSEFTAAAMVQFLNALPNPPQGLFKSWQAAPTFYLEILNEGQTIYFFITTPSAYQEYISSQLSAAYPEVLIQPLKHNPLEIFNPSSESAEQTYQRYSQLKLSSANYLPLQTTSDKEKSGDPLSSLLSTLSKLQTQEVAYIQIPVKKTHEHWKSQAQKHLDQTNTSSGEEKVNTSTLPREHIKAKLEKPSVQATINVLIQAPSQTRAQQIEEGIAQAFNVFDSPYNQLHLSRPWLRKNHHIKTLLNHQQEPSKIYFSTQEVASFYHLPNKDLSSIKNIAWGKSLPGEPPSNLPIHATTPPAEIDELNLFGKVDFKNSEQIFGLKKNDRRRHTYIMGKTGTGKSTLLANMIINDLKHDEGLAIVDPHGDLIDTILNYIPKRRINDTIVLDPSDPKQVVKLNLFEAGSMVHRELVASGLVSMFHKLYGYSWGPRLEYILRNTLLTLLSTQAKLSDIVRLLTDFKYRKRVVEKLDDPILKAFWENEFDQMHERQRIDAISPILNKVGQFVTSPLIRNVVNAKKSSIDIEEIMNEGKIILINVSQGKLGEDNAALLGAMIITKLQLAAMNRVHVSEEERRDFFLYIDEFQNFATDSFIKILSEARKYRLNLTLANQYIAQIPEEVRAAIFGNAGNMMSFIVGAQDAEHLQREFGDQYSQEDLVSLGRYQVICKLMIDNQICRPFPAHTLPLAASSNQNRDKVLRVSRERYARPT